MYTKEKIFNLALGALLLSRQITSAATDASNEAKVLNTHWDAALRSALTDMDLDATSTVADLELIETDPTEHWLYSYKYPSNCALFRRIQSSSLIDSRNTHIPKRVAIRDGQKVIFTNQEEAIGEFIATDLPLTALSADAGLAVAYRLAMLSAPLVTGKGAARLMDSIQKSYIVIKALAQSQDRLENFGFVDAEQESEFVQERLG
jgi:hypothetical protein